jgi:hypothetical protein
VANTDLSISARPRCPRCPTCCFGGNCLPCCGPVLGVNKPHCRDCGLRG